MSHWNHRVMRDKQGDGEYWYGLYEVYYTKTGRVSSWSAEPKAILSDTVEGLKWTLGEMVKALEAPILDRETGRVVAPDDQMPYKGGC